MTFVVNLFALFYLLMDIWIPVSGQFGGFGPISLGLDRLMRLPFRPRCPERALQAICQMRPNPNMPPSDIHGIVVLTQRVSCVGRFSLQVKVSLSGLPENGNWTYHGIHIHESGDRRNGCESMGEHFNPFRTVHGSQRDPIRRRHVGDLGNVVKDPYGHVQGAIFDSLASIVGPYSIINRGIVLHELEDDLGRGMNNESLRSGNAGRRLACCVIEML